MDMKNEIKGYIAMSGETITSVAQKMGITQGALSQQINNESIKHKTLLQIADLLGYEIVWKRKE